MDKLTIRLEAVKLAVMKNGENVIDDAERIERYIIGNSDVPEFNDPNQALMDIYANIVKKTDDASNVFSGCCLGTTLGNHAEEVYLQENGEKVD